MWHWWRTRGSAAPRPGPGGPVLTVVERAQLGSLGIAATTLAGRLRLVLPVGCAQDFTQTRAILHTGAAPDQVDAAIQALIARGARCDCTVFHALGEPAQCVLWHSLAADPPTEPATVRRPKEGPPDAETQGHRNCAHPRRTGRD